MRLSVIVPAFNEEQLLGKTLRGIQLASSAFSARGWETEIIVCDNNSTDRTAELARAAGATVVFEPINQIARARNRGAQAASGDWLIFVDADSVPGACLFSDVADAIASGRCIGGGCVVTLDSGHRLANSVAAFWNGLSRAFVLLAGSFIFCETAAFREVGGFSNEFFAGEELDLTKRLKRLACRRRSRIVILTRHPLVTSARKMHLYTLREHLWIFAKAVFTGQRSLRSREHCATWYDGRR